jgi:hypothetical protein
MLYFNEKEVKILFWGALIAKQKLVCVYFGFFGVCLGYDNNKFVYFDGKEKKLARWVAVCGVWMAKKKKKKKKKLAIMSFMFMVVHGWDVEAGSGIE